MMGLLRDKRLYLVWLFVRVWLGIQWLEAGWHKVLDPAWMQTGDAIRGFWVHAAGLAPGSSSLIRYGWYENFIRWLVDSGQQAWMGKLVAMGELLVGAALIMGVFTVAAAFFAAFMNLNYMLAGTASTNPILYSLAIIIILAGPAAYYWGADRFILPALIRRLTGRSGSGTLPSQA